MRLAVDPGSAVAPTDNPTKPRRRLRSIVGDDKSEDHGGVQPWISGRRDTNPTLAITVPRNDIATVKVAAPLGNWSTWAKPSVEGLEVMVNDVSWGFFDVEDELPSAARWKNFTQPASHVAD